MLCLGGTKLVRSECMLCIRALYGWCDGVSLLPVRVHQHLPVQMEVIIVSCSLAVTRAPKGRTYTAEKSLAKRALQQYK